MKYFLPIFLFLSISLSAQNRWQSTKGTEGAAIPFIYCNSQFAFVFDAYATYRTSDGQSWQQIDQPDLHSVALNDTKMVAIQNYYQFSKTKDKSILNFVVSLDQGLTWQKRTMPPTQSGTFLNAAVSSHGIYVSEGSNSRLFRSVDDGLTWDSIPVPGSYAYEIYQFDDRIFMQRGSEIYLLDPVTLTWTEVTQQVTQEGYINGWYARGDTFLLSTETEIFASLDAGQTWNRSELPFLNLPVTFVQSGNMIFVNKSYYGIYASADAGKSWQPSAQIDNLFTMGKIGGTTLAGTYNKGVFRLDETNMTFVEANTGLYSGVISGLVVSQEKLYASTSNGLFEYEIKDQLWDYQAKLPTTADYGFKTIKASPSGRLATINEYSDTLYLSHDNGQTWHAMDLGQTTWNILENLYWLGEKLCVEGGSLHCTTNYGQTWTPQTTSFSSNPVAFKGKYYGLGWNGQGWYSLYTSSDIDPYWTASSVPLPANFTFLTATQDRLFAVATLSNFQSVLYTSEDGISWKYSNDGIPAPGISPDPSIGSQPKTAALQSGNTYYFYSPEIGVFQSTDSCNTWLPYIWTEYGTSVAIFDTTIFAGSFGGGVVKVSTKNSGVGQIKRGVVYKDENKNGQYETGETLLPNVKVNLQQTGNWYPYWFTYSNQDGKYALATSNGTIDTLKAGVPDTSLVASMHPAYHLTDSPNDLNFGVQFKYDTVSLAMTGNYLGRPRPGFDLTIGFTVNNTGSLVAGGQFGVKFDSNFQFAGANPPPSQIIGTDSAVWILPDIPIFSSAYVSVFGKVKQNATLGDLFKTVATLNANSQDYDSQDNVLVLCDTIVGSYDPNDKRVEPSIGLTQDDIMEGKELVYTIRFQNTGTFPAERVRITDHLSAELDLSTFRFVSSSHQVTSMQMQKGGLLEIVFDQINLPDSTSNEPASHGFVSFAIQRKKQFVPYFSIDNKAAIYFDFNDPIITNTVKTRLYTPPTSSTYQPPNLVSAKNLVLPNPNQGIFQIALEPPFASDTEVLVSLWAENGQLHSTTKLQPTNGMLKCNYLDVPAGFYFVQISQKNQTQSIKVCIQR